MEIYQIRYFLAVSKTLNFTRAAEMCRVSQPALTKAVRKLEEEIGAELIKRQGRHTHLTRIGEFMQGELLKIDADLKGALEAVKKANNLEKTTLRIGVMCTIGPRFHIAFLKEFYKSYPSVELVFLDIFPEKIEKDLLSGKIDCALIGAHLPLSKKLDLHHLFVEKMVVAFGLPHRFEKKKKISLAELAGETYIDRLHCEFRSLFFGEIEKLGFNLPVAYRSEREGWIQALIANNVGIALLPEFIVERKDIETRPLCNPSLSRKINIVNVAGRPKNQALDFFIKTMLENSRNCRGSSVARP